MPNDNPSNEFALTNIDPNRVAEALAALTGNMTVVGQKMNEVKKVRQKLKRDETYYEQEHGIDPKAIRDRYAELQMTPRERERKYVLEQITRRAVNLYLWNADSEEDFEALMAAAAETQAASGDSAMKLAGARAYADGYNSGMNGGSPITDNKHEAGTYEHQMWSLGCADAIGEEDQAEAPPMPAASPKPRGRPPGSRNRKTASELLAENAAKLGAEAAPPLFGDAEEEMPAVGALPE